MLFVLEVHFFFTAEGYSVVWMDRSWCLSLHQLTDMVISSLWHLRAELLYIGFCEVMVFIARYSLLVHVYLYKKIVVFSRMYPFAFSKQCMRVQFALERSFAFGGVILKGV